MIIKLFIMGQANFEILTLPEGATAAQLRAKILESKWQTGQLKALRPAPEGMKILEDGDILEDGGKITFAASERNVQVNGDGTQTVTYKNKKIAGATDDEDKLIHVKFVRTSLAQELSVPAGMPLWDILSMAGLFSGTVLINGEEVWYSKTLNEDTVVELRSLLPTAAAVADDEDIDEDEEEDDYSIDERDF